MKTLSEEIENLIDTGASDFEISKRFKEALSHYNGTLAERFEQSQGKDFLVRHTRALDGFITQMYKTVLRRMFGNYLPMRSAIPVALTALGSYGREQLCIHSDIDLMIVYEPQPGYNTEAIIEKFLYLAWDAGLKLGHRVHRVDELFDAALGDITIRTAMMETRFIVGSNFTWHATQRMLERIRRHEPAAYLQAKLDEARQRREKYPVSMQPQIKEGVGGLRDAQLLYWIAKTRYGVDSLKTLAGSIFSEEEYRQYRIALELIFRVRSALHLAAGKQYDTLNLDYLPLVRKLLGFKSDLKLAEQVIEAMARIDRFSRIYAAAMTRSLFADVHRHYRCAKAARLHQPFYLFDDRLVGTFASRPLRATALVELLLRLPDIPMRFDASVVRTFSDLHVRHPMSAAMRRLLRRLFERRHMHGILELLYDAGTLAELLPALRKTMFLPQFDGYHHYPVGLHALACVRALETIEDPVIAELYETLDTADRTLLKVVVLLHDAGKGRKLDHSEVGAKLIGPLLEKLGFDESRREDAATLVRHHTLMSNIAQRQNIHNEKTLYKFMSVVKTPRMLNLLYILTYADLNGVGEGIYNAFNAKLLYELYTAALEVSQEKERITDAARRLKVEQRIRRLDTYKSLPRLLQKKIMTIESNLFFSRHTPEEILRIAQEARAVKTYDYRLDFETGLSIEILRKIPLNLSYLLGRLGYLDVASMEVFTLFDGVKYFKIDFLQTPTPDMYESIREIVEDSFSERQRIDIEIPRIARNDISIDCEHSRNYAELAVHTANQRGLLAFIVQSLDTLDLQIATAKIHSTKHRARDYFLIEKTPQMCDNAATLIELLSKGYDSCAAS